MNEFYQLIQDTVSRSPIGAKAVAVKIGKPYSTMMREVNPNDKGAKVGADTLMDIVRATKPPCIHGERAWVQACPCLKR